jgi:serine/threonine protein kinase/tetratricopeptide (TPR) repeat protein
MSSIPSREEALFADALAQPTAERGAFLAKACGANLDLLAHLVALLAAHDSGESLVPLLAQRAGERSSPPSEDFPGARIGHYKLLQKIGEGGCGVVWMAEQEEPVRRRVALKVIKLGMDTKAVVARFEAERQALAMMDHPNIARVHDAGSTPLGRPYFVMELVRGISITRYCDENHLTPSERLGLFVTVCHAVQHAHQKGIIHRDLKPSNVLVTLNDGQPTPKVIDFGIAKATQGKLADATLFTAFEQFIGTPVYMSPEQADMSSLDIDTRSDIYSLGVLLYELLTGRPPFDASSLQKAGIEQIRRIIRETEPVRPSTRISTLAEEERSTVAKQRNTAPAQLSLMLRGDLDWIILKALEKNRTRRYESATALADDIGRHMRDEPVIARPPSTGYLLRKLVRRHRAPFAAATVVVLTLAVSAVVSLNQALRAIRAEELASSDRNKVLEEQVRAEKLITYMIRELRPQLSKLGRLDVLEGAAEQSMAYFASLEPKDMSDATLTRHVHALLAIGDLRMEQANYAKAQEAFTEGYSRAVTLAARNPSDVTVGLALTDAESSNGYVHWRRGRFNLAGEWYQRQQNTAARLVALEPTNRKTKKSLLAAKHNLAAVDVERGNFQQAKESMLTELAALDELLREEPSDSTLLTQIAAASSFIGRIAERTGDLPEAGRWYAETIRRREAVTRADPRNRDAQVRLAETLAQRQAPLLAVTGDYAQALDTLKRARDILERLVAHDSANHWWKLSLVTVQLNEAEVATAAGPADITAQLVAAARAAFVPLEGPEPSDLRFKIRLAYAWTLEAEWRLAHNAPNAAVAAAHAVRLGEMALANEPVNVAESTQCARARIVAGRVAASRGDVESAKSHWQRADEVLAPFVPGSRSWRVLDPAARTAAYLGRMEEAQRLVTQLKQIGYVPLHPWPDALRSF